MRLIVYKESLNLGLSLILYKKMFINFIYVHNTKGGGYNEVPTMISGKDLDYLSDIFNWNFNACKLANHFYSELQDEEIKEIMKKVEEIHREHAKAVLNILE